MDFCNIRNSQDFIILLIITGTIYIGNESGKTIVKPFRITRFS